VLAKNLASFAVLLVGNRQQEMFGRDVLVLHLFGLLLGRGKYLRKTRTEILLTALDARKTRDGCLAIIQNDLHIGAEFAEQRANNTLGLFEHGAQDVLRFDLLVLIALGEFYARLNGFLPSQCEFV